MILPVFLFLISIRYVFGYNAQVQCTSPTGEILGVVCYSFGSTYHDSHARERCNSAFLKCQGKCSQERETSMANIIFLVNGNCT